MADKEKQIEEMARFMCDNYEGEGNCGDGNKCDFNCWAYREAEHLYNAGYRKQSDNVIELPCKVGDITYIFDYKVNNHLETKFRGITPSVVEAITIVDDGLWIENEHAKYHISSVGDLIFFTKEEAEQALAKMKGGE